MRRKMIIEEPVDRLVDRNHELFAGFCEWLVKREDLDMDALLYLIEKPWKYTDKFNEYVGVVNMNREIAVWVKPLLSCGRESQ